MKKIDSFLLYLFQRASDWFHAVIGVTNFTLARFFTVVSFVFFILYRIRIAPVAGFGFWDIVTPTAMTVFYFFVWRGIDVLEFRAVQNKLQDPLVITSFYFCRAVCLCYLVFVLSINPMLSMLFEYMNIYTKYYKRPVPLRYIYVICNILFLYFATCISRPQKKFDIKGWISRLIDNSKNTAPQTCV